MYSRKRNRLFKINDSPEFPRRIDGDLGIDDFFNLGTPYHRPSAKPKKSRNVFKSSRIARKKPELSFKKIESSSPPARYNSPEREKIEVPDTKAKSSRASQKPPSGEIGCINNHKNTTERPTKPNIIKSSEISIQDNAKYDDGCLLPSLEQKNHNGFADTQDMGSSLDPRFSSTRRISFWKLYIKEYNEINNIQLITLQNGLYTIGRGYEADICLKSQRVSKIHAKLDINNFLSLHILQTKNGVSVGTFGNVFKNPTVTVISKPSSIWLADVELFLEPEGHTDTKIEPPSWVSEFIDRVSSQHFLNKSKSQNPSPYVEIYANRLNRNDSINFLELQKLEITGISRPSSFVNVKQEQSTNILNPLSHQPGMAEPVKVSRTPSHPLNNTCHAGSNKRRPNQLNPSSSPELDIERSLSKILETSLPENSKPFDGHSSDRPPMNQFPSSQNNTPSIKKELDSISPFYFDSISYHNNPYYRVKSEILASSQQLASNLQSSIFHTQIKPSFSIKGAIRENQLNNSAVFFEKTRILSQPSTSTCLHPKDSSIREIFKLVEPIKVWDSKCIVNPSWETGESSYNINIATQSTVYSEFGLSQNFSNFEEIDDLCASELSAKPGFNFPRIAENGDIVPSGKICGSFIPQSFDANDYIASDFDDLATSSDSGGSVEPVPEHTKSTIILNNNPSIKSHHSSTLPLSSRITGRKGCLYESHSYDYSALDPGKVSPVTRTLSDSNIGTGFKFTSLTKDLAKLVPESAKIPILAVKATKSETCGPSATTNEELTTSLSRLDIKYSPLGAGNHENMPPNTFSLLKLERNLKSELSAPFTANHQDTGSLLRPQLELKSKSLMDLKNTASDLIMFDKKIHISKGRYFNVPDTKKSFALSNNIGSQGFKSSQHSLDHVDFTLEPLEAVLKSDAVAGVAGVAGVADTEEELSLENLEKLPQLKSKSNQTASTESIAVSDISAHCAMVLQHSSDLPNQPFAPKSACEHGLLSVFLRNDHSLIARSSALGDLDQMLGKSKSVSTDSTGSTSARENPDISVNGSSQNSSSCENASIGQPEIVSEHLSLPNMVNDIVSANGFENGPDNEDSENANGGCVRRESVSKPIKLKSKPSIIESSSLTESKNERESMSKNATEAEIETSIENESNSEGDDNGEIESESGDEDKDNDNDKDKDKDKDKDEGKSRDIIENVENQSENENDNKSENAIPTKKKHDDAASEHDMMILGLELESDHQNREKGRSKAGDFASQISRHIENRQESVIKKSEMVSIPAIYRPARVTKRLGLGRTVRTVKPLGIASTLARLPPMASALSNSLSKPVVSGNANSGFNLGLGLGSNMLGAKSLSASRESTTITQNEFVGAGDGTNEAFSSSVNGPTCVKPGEIKYNRRRAYLGLSSRRRSNNTETASKGALNRADSSAVGLAFPGKSSSAGLPSLGNSKATNQIVSNYGGVDVGIGHDSTTSGQANAGNRPNRALKRPKVSVYVDISLHSHKID